MHLEPVTAPGHQPAPKLGGHSILPRFCSPRRAWQSGGRTTWRGPQCRGAAPAIHSPGTALPAASGNWEDGASYVER